MKILRSHITRLTVILLLGTSLGLFATQSVYANESPRDFALWLNSMASTSEAVDLEKELTELENSSYQLDELIAKASKIVSNNNSEFQFPIAGSAASDHIYQLLFFEWTQFQNDNAMEAVPAHKSVKPLASVNADYQLAVGLSPVLYKKPQARSRLADQPAESQVTQGISVVPMSSGMAIHAP